MSTYTDISSETSDDMEVIQSVSAETNKQIETRQSRSLSFTIKFKDLDSCFEQDTSAGKKKCKICQLKLLPKPFNMRRHLSRCHPDIFKNIESKKGKDPTSIEIFLQSKQSLKRKKSNTEQLPEKSREEIDKALTKWIAADLLPFRSVESPAFRELLNLLNPDYEPPTRKVLATSKLSALYDEMFQTIKEDFGKCVSYTVTFDIWTCTKNQNQFLAITGHFVNAEWNLQSYCIGCLPFNEAHTGENIASSINSCINSMDLKLPSFAVTDSGTNVVKACQKMNLERISCIAHTINLCLEPIIFQKSSHESPVLNLMEKIRAIASIFKRSPKLWNEYKSIYKTEMKTNIDPNKIPRDCRTRWNSSFPMIEEVIKQKEPLEIAALKLKTSVLAITQEEKEMLQDLCTLLQPFKEASLILSGSKYPTSSIIFPSVFAISSQMSKVQVDERLVAAKNQIQQEINQRLIPYCRNVNCLIATYLDPRFKKKIFSENDKELIYEGISSFYTSVCKEKPFPEEEQSLKKKKRQRTNI
ncbi:UNVERIFIED_CONTAM: hypothetical protein RMT77_017513 [Armadillidium vulgare]